MESETKNRNCKEREKGETVMELKKKTEDYQIIAKNRNYKM